MRLHVWVLVQMAQYDLNVMILCTPIEEETTTTFDIMIFNLHITIIHHIIWLYLTCFFFFLNKNIKAPVHGWILFLGKRNPFKFSTSSYLLQRPWVSVFFSSMLPVTYLMPKVWQNVTSSSCLCSCYFVHIKFNWIICPDINHLYTDKRNHCDTLWANKSYMTCMFHQWIAKTQSMLSTTKIQSMLSTIYTFIFQECDWDNS